VDAAEVILVLHRPRSGAVIGAAARAAKNTSFTGLRVVGPPAEEDRWMRIWAHASHDVLDGRQEFATLAEAVADCSAVVGVLGRPLPTPRPQIPLRRGMAEWLAGPRTAFVVQDRPGALDPEVDAVVQAYAMPAIDPETADGLLPQQAALLVGHAALLHRYPGSPEPLGVLPEAHKLQLLARTLRGICERVLPPDKAGETCALLLRTLQRGGLSDVDVNIWMGVCHQIRLNLADERSESSGTP
jgi:tRNA C32,U32 (ribose-2'-O)-methylase TrmJ